MPTSHHSKVLIIGSGAAGYTAAIYAARANREPLLIKGLQPGGQLTITTDVENYPGFADVVQGPWLMEQMQAQAAHVGTRMFDDIIVSIDLSRRPFIALGDSGTHYSGDTLIIATGASARWLGLEGEKRFMGGGVSACATCDGFFFRGQHVAVIGGGNTAAEEALFLTNFASKVSLIHRRDQMRAEKILQDRLMNHEKIETIWDHEVEDIIGTDNPPSVTGLKLRHVRTGDTWELPVDGVFVAIGHDPNTGLFKGLLALDDEGYILTAPDSTATDVPGIFAAGDVQDKKYRQAVTAAGTGCMAALEAEHFLSSHADASLAGA
ncbi:MAG: thioredoxin-disulfide reductase [Rhodospirillales bacterium]|jgi:thioredoxin reductase (NADPH)